MGFFSAVKKFFSAEAEQTEKKSAAEIENQQIGEQADQSGQVQEITSDQSEDALEDITRAEETIVSETENIRAPDPVSAVIIMKETGAPEDAGGIAEADKTIAQDAGSAGEPEVITSVSEVQESSGETGKAAAEFSESPQEQKNSELVDLEVTGAVNGRRDADSASLETEAGGIPVAEKIETEMESAPAREIPDENAEMLARLRQSEPKLSAWLNIILENVEEADALLWERLRFLLRSLQAPEEETDTFIADFRKWLERMEYRYLDEFRSELQYRLALALDLEDEEDERNRLLLKLNAGLAKTREQFGRSLDRLFSGAGELNQDFWNELEELFIMSDMGYDASLKIVERLKERARREKVTKACEGRRLLLEEMEEIFAKQKKIEAVNKPEIILMIGVNGVGKTTTIAKLAYRRRLRGEKVLIAAADTFRAAAIEQLQIWAERTGAEFYAKAPGSDPASVAWEAIEYAQKNGIDTVFIDTAGRLQTKVNLMEELGKIRQVAARKQPGAPHRGILVLDATTGQNALSQAKLFKEAAGADEIILTKLDGTAKGGVAIAVAMQENLPITFIGLGEKMEDLRPFNGRDFAAAILGETVEA